MSIRATTLATASTAALCLLLAVVQINNRPRALLQKTQPHVNVWQQIGAQEPSKEAQDVMFQNDKVGYRAARVTQLAMRGQPTKTTVWQQIGAPEPSKEAENVMFQNDKVGYKATKQMLAEDKVPSVNVWQQIGAKEPSAAAKDVMRQNDDAGYKAKTQQLSQVPTKKTTVWQQIGAPEPSKEAENVMFQNDKVGYKAKTQMLAMKKRSATGGNIFASKQPRNTVWRQIGAPDPASAAQKVMAENDQVGYKAATQMLHEQAPKSVNVWQQIGAQEPAAEANNVMQENDKVGY